MKAIDFVARTSAGSSQAGVVPADDNVVAIDAGAGQEISLNLRQSDIRSYNREGRNLEIVLSDGRLVILENYFGTDGAPQSRLFISADGYLNEVSMSERGDGQIYAQYGPTEQWGKWSPTEDLIFLDGGDLAVAGGEEDVSMLAAAGLLGGNGLLGALGIGAAGIGGAALMGTGGDGGTGDDTPVDPDQPGDGDDGDTGDGDTGDGDTGDGDTGDGDGDGDSDKPGTDTDSGGGDTGGETGGDTGGETHSRIEPSINEPGPIVVGGDDVDPETDTITITGRAEPGSNVTVTIGDTSVETIADDNGDWAADFTGGTFPDDGEYIVTATVTEPDGTETVITGPQVVVDITGPDISVLEGTVSVDEIINAEEYEAGIEVSGTGEPGAAIVVSVEGVVHGTSVAEDGTWSVTYAAGDLPRGEYTTEVTVVSTDAFGNSTTLTDSMQIDTIPHDLVINTGMVEGDGVINFVENEDGFTLTGSSAPGAMVTVEIEGVSQTVEVAQDGRWSADFAAGTVPGGEYDADVTATTQDIAGNVTVTTGTIGVDTLVRDFSMQSAPGGADGVINAAERGEGFAVTGTTEPGATVSLEMNGQTVNAVVAADGSWTANFTGAQIAQGTYTTTMTATTVDAAGNVETLSQSVSVDTDPGVLTLNAAQIGGDGTINKAEAAAGVAVTGTADPDAIVEVTLDGVRHTVQADGSGNWTTTYLDSEITPGSHDPVVTATTTDPAGNVARVDGTVHVDTEVLNLSQDPYDLAVASDGSDVINNSVATAGFQITGTVEQGSSVMVTVGGVTRPASVDGNGNWSANFAAGSVGTGERDMAVEVAVTDPAGNTERLSDTIRLDTLVNQLALSPGGIEGDNVVNAAEARDGVQISGQVEPGSTVSLDAFGKSYDATVAASGAWALTIPAADVADMEATASLIISATDPAGNIRSMTQQLSVDTVIPDQPDIVGAFRQTGGGYRSVTTETTGDAVSIHQVDSSGDINELSLHVTEDAFLGETNHLFLGAGGTPQSIPDGSELIITNTDDAGNASSTYVVLDETSTNAVNAGSLATSGFNIDEIDLGLGDQRELTITEEQLVALSQNGDQLIVRGGSDDTVTLTGAEAAGQTQIEGETFNLYTLGTDGASIMIEEDVNVNGLI